MRYLVSVAIFVLASSTSFASTTANDVGRPPALDCKFGPLHRSYGRSDWLVYGCSDLRSVVVVSEAGNPAAPFYFILYVKPDGSLQLYGEGDGKKAATQAAFDELKTLQESDVASLVSQAQDAGGSDK